MDTELLVKERVHHMYYDLDLNCARTTMMCLGELFDFKLEEQTLSAAIGMHGAGGFRAQCGLVEGALMFMGAYYSAIGLPDVEAAGICYEYANAFNAHFGSLLCSKLRPGGFRTDDPPHLCENLTADSICFAFQSIRDHMGPAKASNRP